MASRALSRCGVPEGSPSLGRLNSRGVYTAGQLLREFSALELSEALDLSLAEATALLVTVSAAVAPPARRASALLSTADRRRVSTGIELLDYALRGGFPAGAITELVGPAGVGKTQACLQASALAVSSTTAVLYVDTENKFHSGRFLEIATARLRGATGEESSSRARAALRQVILIKVTTLDELLQRVSALEAPCIDHNVSLVVVDSIAHLVRIHPRGDSYDVQDTLGRIAAGLKRLAEALELPVLMTNQVATRFGAELTHRIGVGEEKRGVSSLGAALGTAWAHAINTRLVLEAEGGRHRRIRVAKSPTAPCCVVPFKVTNAGMVQDLDEGRLPSVVAAGSALDVNISNELDYRTAP